jgi:ligand-binding sensor domain-containing protein
MKKIFSLLFLLSACYLFSAGKWTSFKITEEGYSPKNDITAICFDKQGCLWVGTSDGIYKKEEKQWELQGIGGIYVQSLYIDRSNTKWVGLWGGGVYKSDSDSIWKNVKEASPTNSVNVITADHQGNIWIGNWNGGAANYNGQCWRSYKSDSMKLGDNTVTSIACDSKNRMWIGTYHGLSKLEHDSWTLYNKDNSQLPDNDVYSLAADNKGNVWAGTCDGLVKINGSHWIIYRQENSGLPCNLILSIAIDAKGNIWIGTNKGIAFFNGKNWITYTVENSRLIDNRVQTITVHDNAIYFGTSSGVSVLEEQP